MWKSAGRAPSLRVLPWNLPYNWAKSTEKPQSEYSIYITKFLHINQNTHTLCMYVTQKYWKRMTVFPCQRFQYLFHCWHWRVYVSTTERRNSCISMVAVVRGTYHILTLYVHIAILVNNVKIYTCFSPICIQKTHDFSTSTWKLLVLRIFSRHIICLWQLTIF
jgi:hypothetical protein